MHVAASRYRVLQYLPFFRAAGIDTEVFEFPQRMAGWSSLWEFLKKGDVIFVQRKRLPFSVLLFLKRLKKKILYDFDDAVMFKNSLSKNPYSLRRTLSFKRMLHYTDLVVAGNGFLKPRSRKISRRVKALRPLMPSATRRRKTIKAKIRSTWDGLRSWQHPLYGELQGCMGGHRESTRMLFSRLFVILLLDTKDITLRRILWSYEREIDDLMSLDIGLMLLLDDLWSKGNADSRSFNIL